MKKLLIVLGTLVMLFSVALVASAAAEQQGALTVYGDLGVSGASNNTVDSSNPMLPLDKDTDYDGTSGYLLGAEYDWGPFLVVAEYTENTFDAPKGESDYRSNTTLIRGGYYFINNEKIKIDAVLGYMRLDTTNKKSSDKANDLTNGGTIVGIDGTYNFTDKFSLNGSYAVTVGADCSVDNLDKTVPSSLGNASVSKSSSLSTYRLKGIYQWNDHISSYVSYSFLESKLKYSYKGVIDADVDIDSTWYGWALGVIYKF